MKKAGTWVAAVAVVAVILVLLAHAPFVRTAVLQYAIDFVERNYGLTLHADRLDYNLATLRVGLAGLRVSAENAVSEPFFEAEYVSVALPGSSLLGNVAFEEININNGRVFVHRRADGTSNLPQSEGEPVGDPPALRVERLNVTRLSVDVRDEQADMTLSAPAIGVVLTPDDGSLSLAMPADLRVGRHTTRIFRLNGQAAFDGRALHLMATEVQADEGAMTLDGTLLLVARETSLDLTAKGTADLARLARWGMDSGDLPQGQVTFRATAAGPMNSPETRLDVAAPRLSFGRLVATDLSAQASLTQDVALVEALQFGFSSGRVTADASLPLASGARARVNASWSGVDAALAVQAAAPESELLPAASVAGRVSIEGVLSDVTTWSGAVSLQMAPGPNARGRIAVAGDASLDLRERRWRLTGRPRIADAASVDFAAQGSLREPLRSPLTGTLSVARTDLPSLVASLRATGLVDAPADAITSGSFVADFDLGGSVEAPTIAGRVDANGIDGLQASMSSATAEVSGQPLEPSLDVRLEAPDLVVSGQRLSEVRAAGRVNGTSIVLTNLSASQPGAAGVVSGSGTYDITQRRYTVVLGGTSWQLMPTTDQPLAGHLDLRFEGSGTVDVPRGSGELRLSDASWQQTTLGTVEASVELNGKEAQIDARAPDFDATATGRVQIVAPYAADVVANAGRLDLARALQGIETPTPVAGTVGLMLRYEGPLEAWRTGSATLEATSLDATAGNLVLRLAQPALVRYGRERVVVDNLEVDVGETRLSATGELDAFEPSRAAAGVLVTLTGEVGEVARAAAATGITDVPIEGGSGPVALLARINGSLESPLVAADLELGPGSITVRDLPPVSDVVLRAHAENGWLELREGALSFQQAAITVTGRAPLSWIIPSLAGGAPGDGEVHARATNLTASILEPFLDAGTAEQLDGSVDATLDLSSSTLELSALTGELRLDRLDVRVADLPVTQLTPTRIVARDGFARVESWDWEGQGATLNVRGQVRLEDRQAAILAGGVVDLRMLTPFVRGAGMTTVGRLEPRLSITGPLDNPRVDGDMTLTGGELRLADPRVIVSGLTMRSVVSSTSARITSLTGTANGGELTGSGNIEYSPELGLNVQLSTAIDGMALDFPEGLRSEVNANLDLSLKVLPEPMGRLSGTITVVRGAYREPLAVVTGLLAGAQARQVAAGANIGSPILRALALDLQLVTEEDVQVNNNYGRLQLGADLRIVGTAAAPAVTGRADLREGGQLFVGRNVYAITSGTIDFTNPVAIEPVLNVQATTRAAGEDIEVAITGPAQSPKYELTSPSNPDLGQADLVSLLLTGRRYDDLAPDDAAFVGTQVLGNLSGEVLGFAGRAIGLDTIRLGGPDISNLREDPIAVVARVDPTTRLTFGKSIGSDLDVTLSQSLRDGDAQTWIVDYRAARGLELRYVSDDENLGSYGFRHDLAFGGPPRPVQNTPSRSKVDRVSSVEVSGELALPQERVRRALRLEPGDRFDFVDWQTDRDRLEALYFDAGYLTARITAERAEVADGIALEYQITAGPMTVIVASGIDLDGEVRAQLRTAWTQSVFDDFLREEATQIVREALAADGYLRPVVDVQIRDEGTTRTLSIMVDRDGRTSQTSVRVEGVDEGLAASILAQLEEQRLVDQAVSNPAALERSAADFLRSQGYLQAQVAARTPVFDGTTAIVPLNVVPGPAYVLAAVRFEGAMRLQEDMLREAAALKEGVPYDALVVEGARASLEARYRREAFTAATVTARTDIRPDSTNVDVTFAVREGPQQVFGDAVVMGNRSVDTDVIVTRLGFAAEAPMRPEDLVRARTRLLDMGLFRRVDIESDPLEPAGSGAIDERNIPMRLRITVEEWPALRLRYGFELAQERPEDSPTGTDLVPGLAADVTRRTMFGRAIAFGGAVEYQRRERAARLFLNTSTLLGWPIGSSLIAERSRIDSATVTLVTDRSSLSWEQRTRVVPSLTLSYAYRFERVHTFDTKPSDPFAPVFDITINVARLTAAAAWDTRDDPADTARGSLFSLSFENAPEAGGSDIRFVRQLAQAYHFRPWRQVILASAARFGIATPLGGQELIPSERFFAGGARTVRGVPEDSLGPRDVFFNEPEGGQVLIVLNQEVRFPLYRWLRGVAYVDAGNVFAVPSDASLADLVGSLGVGLRLATPFALLRADFAKAAWGAPAGLSGRWIFGIGQAF